VAIPFWQSADNMAAAHNASIMRRKILSTMDTATKALFCLTASLFSPLETTGMSSSEVMACLARHELQEYTFDAKKTMQKH
jgi:hypothetical protein